MICDVEGRVCTPLYGIILGFRWRNESNDKITQSQQQLFVCNKNDTRFNTVPIGQILVRPRKFVLPSAVLLYMYH